MQPNEIWVPGIGAVHKKTVRKTIRSLCTLKEFAEEMKVHPSALSKWLSGVNQIPVNFAAMIIIVARQLEAQGEFTITDNWPADSEPVVQIAHLKNEWQAGRNPFTGEDIDKNAKNPATNQQTPIDPNVSWKETALRRFPEKAWYEFITGSRKAYNEGQSNTALGPRANITMHQSYLALVNDGFDPEKAFAQAFKHTILDRVLESEQEFLGNLYFAVMGHRHSFKDEKHPQTEVSDVPFAPYIMSYVKFGIPVWVYGSPGSGKTFGTEIVANKLNRTMVRVPCSKFLTPEEVFAGLEIKNSETYPKDGMVTEAVRAVYEGTSPGCVILIDEFSRLQPGLSTTFHSLMEMRELVVPLTGERIPVDRTKVAIVINDNLRGLAEDAAFSGAESVDEATRDRCVFVAATYPDQDTEKYIIEESVKWVPEAKFNLRYR